MCKGIFPLCHILKSHGTAYVIHISSEQVRLFNFAFNDSHNLPLWEILLYFKTKDSAIGSAILHDFPDYVNISPKWCI